MQSILSVSNVLLAHGVTDAEVRGFLGLVALAVSLLLFFASAVARKDVRTQGVFVLLAVLAAILGWILYVIG